MNRQVLSGLLLAIGLLFQVSGKGAEESTASGELWALIASLQDADARSLLPGLSAGAEREILSVVLQYTKGTWPEASRQRAMERLALIHAQNQGEALGAIAGYLRLRIQESAAGAEGEETLAQEYLALAENCAVAEVADLCVIRCGAIILYAGPSESFTKRLALVSAQRSRLRTEAGQSAHDLLVGETCLFYRQALPVALTCFQRISESHGIPPKERIDALVRVIVLARELGEVDTAHAALRRYEREARYDYRRPYLLAPGEEKP